MGKTVIAEATNGTNFIIDEDDFMAVSELTWDINYEGYVRHRSQRNGVRKQILLHRLLLSASQGELVDHIDGNKLNNSKSNLRVSSEKENSRNRKTPIINKSGYKGVSPVKGYSKYKSYVQLNDKQAHLGYFDDKHEAARMYNFWANDLFGEYARLNEINDKKWEVVAHG